MELNLQSGRLWSFGRVKASFPYSWGMARTSDTHLIHHMFYSTALQERYEKESGKSSAVTEGHGDAPGELTPTVLAPMPLAEVELKWEMEKEEKRLLWEQLQGLEVNLAV